MPTDSKSDCEKPPIHELQPQDATEKSEDGTEDTHISFRPVERVDVSVRNLTITVVPRSVGLPWGKKKEQDEETGKPEVTILDNVSADMPAGSLMAIIGGSGSGKTSMLNVMSHRMRSQSLRISGTTTFNRSEILATIRHAYVMQQDVLLPRLTVRETLRYSAELRLPAGTSAVERETIVEEVILQLGLKECANTLIGDDAHKGCSGGEKRRVSIGVQLLANPSLLFLDEPTTGLDATSAFQLVRTLKDLAQKGRTIITTIHQPRSEIWGLFDRITLLSKGNPLYSGRVSKVLPYFDSLGFPFPEYVNPADYLVDLAAVDYRSPEAEQSSLARVESLVNSWRESEATILSPSVTKEGTPSIAATLSRTDHDAGSSLQAVPKPRRVPILRQVGVLFRRTLKMTFRDPFGLAGCLVEALIMGLIAGWIFANVDRSLSGIRTRQAALYLAAALQGYLILLFETYRLCEVDIKVFDREHGEGVVGVFAFLCSRRLAKFCTEDVLVPLIFSSIYYFIVGFEHDAVKFFTFFSIVLLGQYCAISFATVCVAVSRNFSEAVLMANLAYTVQSMACGYFIQSSTMPVYVRWTRYIAYNWYAVGALAANEFTDEFYDCPLEGGRDNPACQEYDGNFVLDSLDFPKNWIMEPICINLCWVIGFWIIAGLLLRFFSVDINVSSVKVNEDKDSSAGKEKMASEEAAQGSRKIDVVLEDYKLNITKPGFFGRGKADLEILKGVSTRFEAGKLNVIMGPSGSGKTSLLNLMARRLHSSIGTRYHLSGKMLFNGALPSDKVIRSLCSYVTQDDDALLPFLTVRETLRFAAALRLPRTMTSAEKKRRAEEVLLKLGLRDCADTVIGSEFTKGISGGEKRRVTIAVQLLTAPKILVCDEPSSGLDSFTAASIIKVLRGLADEGCTVICTIHQSRSDVFESFDNLLLLARGGHTVYSGQSSQMLPYFASLGYECPATTNPADFALDLVTVDLQHAARERRSRVQVQGLISRFSHIEALADAAPESRTVSLPAELGQMRRSMAPLRVAYPILVRRAALNFHRQPALVVARIMQVVGLGIVLALFFAPLGNDYYAVQNRLGYIQQVLPLYFVGMLQNISVYPAERDVFYKEHSDRAYSTTAFFLAYTSTEIPFEILTSLLFSCLATLAVGLPRTPDMFFIVALNALLITSCGESVGMIFLTLFRHTGFSVNLTSTVLSIGVLMSGIMSIDMSPVLEAFNYLSPMKYAAQNLTPYSLHGVEFYCTARQRLADGSCPITRGEQALALYGMDGYVPWKNLVALAACTIIYRMVAYALLRVRMTQWGVREFGKSGWRGKGKSEVEKTKMKLEGK